MALWPLGLKMMRVVSMVKFYFLKKKAILHMLVTLVSSSTLKSNFNTAQFEMVYDSICIAAECQKLKKTTPVGLKRTVWKTIMITRKG